MKRRRRGSSVDRAPPRSRGRWVIRQTPRLFSDHDVDRITQPHSPRKSGVIADRFRSQIHSPPLPYAETGRPLSNTSGRPLRASPVQLSNRQLALITAEFRIRCTMVEGKEIRVSMLKQNILSLDQSKTD